MQNCDKQNDFIWTAFKASDSNYENSDLLI